MHFDIANPLTPQSTTPSVTGDLRLRLDASDPQSVIATLVGQHDCFPAWEVYLNDQPVYQYRPNFSLMDPGPLARIVNFTKLSACLAGIGQVTAKGGAILVP